MKKRPKRRFLRTVILLSLFFAGINILSGCAYHSHHEPVPASITGPAVIYDKPPGYRPLRPKYNPPPPYYYYPRTRLTPGYGIYYHWD